MVTTVLGDSASHNGANLTVTASVEAPKGYRLLDLSVPSNGVVPLRSQDVTVTVAINGNSPQVHEVALNANGSVTVDLGGQAGSATSVTVEDRFGNSGARSLP